MAVEEKDFEMPWQYSFPPFFTLQPNTSTRRLQVEAWCGLVMAYYRANRLHTLDVNDAHSSSLFANAALNRKLSSEMIYLILEELRKSGNVEWLDKQRRRCWVLWKSVEEWAKYIYDWAVRNGMLNTVCTLYELREGEDTKSEDFHGMDQELMYRVLKHLQQNRKAELISVNGEATGVKFF